MLIEKFICAFTHVRSGRTQLTKDNNGPTAQECCIIRQIRMAPSFRYSAK